MENKENLNNQLNTNNNGNKGLMIVLIAIGLILVGMVGYKIFADSSNGKQETNGQSSTQEKECDCSKCKSTTDQQDGLKNSNGKIVITRNGIAKLESVPSDIVGKYVNDAGDYYMLNNDGTAEIYANCGGDCAPNEPLITSKEASFQLSYVGSENDQTVIVEFYLNSNTHSHIPGTAIYGYKWEGSYSFEVISNTPTSTVGETRFAKK